MHHTYGYRQGECPLVGKHFFLVPYALERANCAQGKTQKIKFLISLVGELLLSPSTSSSCILFKYTP